jgi:hypothetical protein
MLRKDVSRNGVVENKHFGLTLTVPRALQPLVPVMLELYSGLSQEILRILVVGHLCAVSR